MQMCSERSQNSTCDACSSKDNGLFCHLTSNAARDFESIKFTSTHPAGSLLFLENDSPRGVFLVCSGKVKLSMSFQRRQEPDPPNRPAGRYAWSKRFDVRGPLRSQR